MFFETFNVYLKLEGKENILLCIFDYLMIKPSLIAVGCMMLVISEDKNLTKILSHICLYDNIQINDFCVRLKIFMENQIMDQNQ